MKVIRVFPQKTTFTPDDDYCFYDSPGLFIPKHDEIHISCVFTWDIPRALELQKDWQAVADHPAKIGGPVFDDSGGEFIPGMYLKNGVTINSRGCNNNCSFCHVPRREGRLRKAGVKIGNIGQSNNLMQCSRDYRRKIYDMMKTQKQISFRGGIEAAILSDRDIEEMRGLKISDIWLACDTKGAINNLKKATEKLQLAGFNQNKIRCYVLIGDDMQENENRLKAVYEAGALPFTQLFQPENRIEYSREWKQFTTCSI
jgi:hypothetical protein